MSDAEITLKIFFTFEKYYFEQKQEMYVKKDISCINNNWV